MVKLNPAGSGLAYATFLGGSTTTRLRHRRGRGGQRLCDGRHQSSDFPTTPGAFDTSYNGGHHTDAFVVKLNPAGSGLAYATFLGGSGDDSGTASRWTGRAAPT